jgi:hypothetical protein
VRARPPSSRVRGWETGRSQGIEQCILRSYFLPRRRPCPGPEPRGDLARTPLCGPTPLPCGLLALLGKEAPPRASGRWAALQSRPVACLDCTRGTRDEWPPLVPPGEAACHAPMAAWYLFLVVCDRARFPTPRALLASPPSSPFPPVPPEFTGWSACPRCAILGIAQTRTAPAGTVPDARTSPSRSGLRRTVAARGTPSGERGWCS